MKQVIIEGNTITRICSEGNKETSSFVPDLEEKIDAIRSKRDLLSFANNLDVDIPDNITKLNDMKEFVKSKI